MALLMRDRARIWKQAGLMAGLCALTACAPAMTSDELASAWLEAGSPKALEVEQTSYRHAVHFETDRAEITAAEQDRLLGFMQAVRLKPGEQVRIEGHADERAGNLYNLDLASRRTDAVRGALISHGFDARQVSASAFGEHAPLDPAHQPDAWARNRRVDIVLERYMVTPPPCPDWSRLSGRDYANLRHSNFGCATATNLGLMVADPRDLVRGRSLGPADGVHQAEGIVRYREGELNELVEEEVE